MPTDVAGPSKPTDPRPVETGQRLSRGPTSKVRILGVTKNSGVATPQKDTGLDEMVDKLRTAVIGTSKAGTATGAEHKGSRKQVYVELPKPKFGPPKQPKPKPTPAPSDMDVDEEEPYPPYVRPTVLVRKPKKLRKVRTIQCGTRQRARIIKQEESKPILQMDEEEDDIGARRHPDRVEAVDQPCNRC